MGYKNLPRLIKFSDCDDTVVVNAFTNSYVIMVRTGTLTFSGAQCMIPRHVEAVITSCISCRSTPLTVNNPSPTV